MLQNDVDGIHGRRVEVRSDLDRPSKTNKFALGRTACETEDGVIRCGTCFKKIMGIGRPWCNFDDLKDG